MGWLKSVMSSRAQLKRQILFSAGTLVLLATLCGCEGPFLMSSAPLDRLVGHTVGVRVIPVATGANTCRIDMSVTNFSEDGSVRPFFKVQILSTEEWAKVPKPFFHTSIIRPYGQMENILFDQIPAGKTGAKSLATLDLPCSELQVFAFWEARSKRVVTRFPLLTPLGQPYFDQGTRQPMLEQFSQVPLVECSPTDFVCSGPIDTERILLGYLENLNMVTEPETAADKASFAGPRIDLSIARTLVAERACEISMIVTNMTAEKALSPALEVEIGILADDSAEHPPSSRFEVSFGPIAPNFSDEGVVGMVNVPCWRLDTLKFLKVCDQHGEKCEDLFRIVGKPFLNRTSGVYLTISLKNTPMYRRP